MDRREAVADAGNLCWALVQVGLGTARTRKPVASRHWDGNLLGRLVRLAALGVANVDGMVVKRRARTDQALDDALNRGLYR